MSALKPKTRGRKSGMCRTLSAEQEKRIQQLICEKRPEQHTDKLEVFFLPSYSPELNPDERLNTDLKR